MRNVQIKCNRERRLFDTIEGSRLKILIKCSNTKACPYKSDCLRTTEIILGAEKEAFDEFYNLYGEIIHEEVRIRTGVKEVLDKLIKNHKIHFITAREAKMKNVTEKWLLHHELPLNTLSLLGSHNKVAKAQELECDIFIEDSYENAVQLASSGFTVLLIDCYYNQGHLYTGITRVMDWLEIIEFIEEYEQQCLK